MFITLEGGEGCGKSTVVKTLAGLLQQTGKHVTITREPGGVDISEDIRDIILDNKNTGMSPRTEALLYAASRAQHLKEKIMPAIDRGDIVICDRFIDSSLVYQGIARGLGIGDVYAINKFAIGNMMPDLTIYLDVPPEVGLARVQNRGDALNRLDNEKLDFHKAVRNGYFEIINSRYNDHRIYMIDATQPLDKVIDDCLRLISLHSKEIDL